MRIEVDQLDKPTHPDGLVLLDYFESHRARGVVPRRADLPAREIVRILPNVFILEPIDPEGLDWRLRLLGQGLVDRFGADPTGLAISQIYATDQVEYNAGVYRAVVAGERLSVTRGTFQDIDREFLTFEIVHTPIIGSDEKTRWVLGGIFFEGHVLSE